MEIAHHNKKKFVTDSLQDKHVDVVFPIFEDESIYFANHIQARPSDVILDIGTGSGILAITAAKRAKHVTALDIQSRALKFASFNAYLNGVEDKITFVKSDGLAKIRGRFDVALFNPPFNPAPKNLVGKIFSHGGDDGTYITRKVFPKLPQIIKARGYLQMITFSLGKNNRPLIFDLVKNFYIKETQKHTTPTSIHQSLIRKLAISKRFLGPSISHGIRNSIITHKSFICF